MGFLNITKLQPGRSYSVVVRARDDNGFISENSLIYNFTVPSKNSDGTQLTAINSAVVTALAPDSSSVTGGAIVAGGLDSGGTANAGAINLGSVWNGSASSIAKLTGTANTGAVIINSTGILGYQLTSTSSGQANFFLDTASGNAYFRGTVFANAGKIGGFSIDSISLSASTFFNKLTSFDPSFEDNWLNYWSASAQLDGNQSRTTTLQNEASLTPQAGLKYATFVAYAEGKNFAQVTGSSAEMTMFKSASAKTAFSQTDLGISPGSTYTFSVYAQDIGSSTFKSSPYTITILPAQLFLKINKYSSASTGSATFTGSAVSPIVTTSSTSWTRISASFTTSSAEYYTFSIINAQDYQESQVTVGVVTADSSFAIDAIQLNAGNTATNFGFDNYFAVSPSDSKPINLSSIGNTGSTSNIFSVYTDGGVYANYFFSNKQSKIGSVYFGARKSSNISIGDYFATNQNNTNGNNINIGNMSLGAHISGSNNIAIGYNAAGYVGYGSNNVVIGGYTGELYWTNNNVVIADGSGSVRFRSDSTGSVTITGSVTATAFIGDGSRLTGIGGSSSVSYATNAGSATYASSAGYLPVSGLSASTITIGSTSIGLGNTSTSLSNLSTFSLTNSTDSTTIFSISGQASNATGGGLSLTTSANSSGTTGTATGGALNLSTSANAGGAGSNATGGNITIRTTAGQTGATATSAGGNITISTDGSGSGFGGTRGGNISIATTKGTIYDSSGSITITSNGNFAITAAGSNVGTINNFNIGATTAGTGRFTSLTVTSSSINMGTNTLNIYDNSASTRINLASSGEVLFGRQNTSNEGGNIQLANALDNAAGWNIDSYGTTASPDLRFFVNGNVRLTLNGVSGNATFTNAVSAQSFSGDGSGLTNLPSGNPTYAQVLTSTTTSTSGSSLFAVFPAGSSNFNLKANTVYYFEGAYLITKAATATNANWTFGLVFSQTQQNLYYTITGTSNSATAATLQASTNSQSTSLNIGTAGTTSAGLIARFQGFFVTNATNGGTLTPSFGQSVTPSSGSPTVSTGAYFRLVEHGSNFPVVSGSWT